MADYKKTPSQNSLKSDITSNEQLVLCSIFLCNNSI